MSNKGLEFALHRALRSIEETASKATRAAYVKNDHHTDWVDDGLTLLQQAIRTNDNRMLDTLCFVETTCTIALDGVTININEKDLNGNTALHHAALAKSRFAETLVSLKADPTITNKEGKIPQNLVKECDHLYYTLSPEIWPERETSEPGHSGWTMIDGPDGESTTYKNWEHVCEGR